MRQDHAVQAKDRQRRQTKRAQHLINRTRPAKHRQQPQHSHDHRQQKGGRQQPHQHPPPPKPPPRQGPRQGHRQQARHQRRQRRLQQGKPQRRTIGGAECPFGGPRSRDCGAAKGQRRNAQGQKGWPYWAKAACHSPTAVSRNAPASSCVSRSDFAGWIRVSNPAGKPAANVLAGYIQFVVGITDCAASDTR